MGKKIVVLGGGICGLAISHKLSKDGHQVILCESSEQLGGLGTFFKHNDKWLDKFYHCQMPTDDYLLPLIEEVGLKNEMYWNPTRMGFIVDQKRYPFNTAIDLLKFQPLSFIERIRFGVVSLLIRFFGKGKDLDNLPIEKWFTSLYGKNIWERILKQLFLSKFGNHAGNLPSLYIWQRLGREKNVAKRGYINGGLKSLIDAIEYKIKNYGGEIKLNSPVQKLEKLENGIKVFLKNEIINADWVLSTIPIPLFNSLIKDSEPKINFVDPKLTYQGVVNAMLFLRRPLDNYYWTPVVNSGTEFDGIVEMTELIKKEHYGNYNVVYLMKYCNRNSDLFLEDEQTILERWKKQLVNLYSDINLTEKDIVYSYLFKAPFVEPIYPLGYSKIKPKMKIDGANIILATSAQVYPQITSWNASTGLANESVEMLYKLI